MPYYGSLKEGVNLKVVFFEDLTQDFLNEMIEGGEIFIAIGKDTLLSKQTIVRESDTSGSSSSVSRVRYL